MSVWSIGSLDEEQKKKDLMSAMPQGFKGPNAVKVQDSMGTQIMKQAGGAMASKVGSAAGTAIGNAVAGPIGGFIGSALGGAAGGALAGGSGSPQAQTPTGPEENAMVAPVTRLPGPLNPQADQMALDEEDYYNKNIGVYAPLGGHYAV